MENVIKITSLARKDIRAMTGTIGSSEARYLVDLYYQVQEFRKAAANQRKAALKADESCEFLGHVFSDMETVESNIKIALDEFTKLDPVGVWAKSVVGIGPVISAGLLAHIDITKAPTVGHIWRYAGLDPTVKWERKCKRPWNAELKTLCWKIGESFVKVCNNPNALYGRLYTERKQLESGRNEAGEFAQQAAAALEAKNIGKDTDAYAAYSVGKLPPAHIHSRAKRWAVKLFLAHWHEVAYRLRYGVAPPKPYVMEHLGHAHMIEVPNLPVAA